MPCHQTQGMGLSLLGQHVPLQGAGHCVSLSHQPMTSRGTRRMTMVSCRSSVSRPLAWWLCPLPPHSFLMSPTSKLVLDTNICSRSQVLPCLYVRQAYSSRVASVTPAISKHTPYRWLSLEQHQKNQAKAWPAYRIMSAWAAAPCLPSQTGLPRPKPDTCVSTLLLLDSHGSRIYHAPPT